LFVWPEFSGFPFFLFGVYVMSILFSVLSLAGDKAAALQSSRDDVIKAAALGIAHGNFRNMQDTAARLRDSGAVTKAGNISKNRKGEILAALVAASNMAVSIREAFKGRHAAHKGKPTSAMVQEAEALAVSVGDCFEAEAMRPVNEKAAARAAAKAEAEAAPKAEAEAEAAPKAEAEAATKAEAEAATDQGAANFAALVSRAVAALGRDKLTGILTVAILEAEAEAAMEAEAEAEAEAAAPKKRRARKAA
jgi:colicin import membrane protein